MGDPTDPGTWVSLSTIGEKVTQTVFGAQETQEDTFWHWKKVCDRLPKYDGPEVRFTALQKETMLERIHEFLKNSREPNSFLTKEEHWFNKVRPSIEFFDPFKKDLFLPYVQKLIVPSNAVISFHGDLHGDIHSLNAYLAWLIEKGYLNDKLEIQNDAFYMVFLGDYTDRGWYGAEVIYTILNLKVINPEKVVLVRGNHEDGYMNTSFGFEGELRTKFYHAYCDEEDFQDFTDRLYRIYNYMPVALYLGCQDKQGIINFLQCCHGGMEIGFDPKPLLSSDAKTSFQLLGKLERFDQIRNLRASTNDIFTEDFINAFRHNNPELQNFVPSSPTGFLEKKPSIGFMWYDFIVKGTPSITYNPQRGWSCGKGVTQAILQLHSTDKVKVRGVFRAHQHSLDPKEPMMRRILGRDKKMPVEDQGVGKLWIDENSKQTPGQLWDGIVCTFCVSPCTPYGQKEYNDFSYDAFGLLQMAESFQDWKLQVIRQEMLEEVGQNDKGV